jgi:glycosyltransferase involved in cell wall biosynthesis
VLQQLIDSKVLHYYYQTNKGKANATAFGINISSGKYIFNLDADDYFLPNKIIETVAIFETDSTIVHVASPAICSKEKKWEGEPEQIPHEILGKAIKGSNVLELFYNRHILYGGGSTFAARASVLKTINIPNGVDMYIDEFLILAIFPLGAVYFIKKPLSVWRIHSSNFSVGKNDIQKKIEKNNRLLKSSFYVQNYLVENSKYYTTTLLNIYKLIHLTREIGFKQQEDRKTTRDIFLYFNKVFFELRIGISLANKYFVFNMLIPNSLRKLLKAYNTQKVS